MSDVFLVVKLLFCAAIVVAIPASAIFLNWKMSKRVVQPKPPHEYSFEERMFWLTVVGGIVVMVELILAA